jgi:small subunit ribosomal protein S17
MPNNRRRLVGRVVSDKMEKTVVVAVERRKMHRIYKKVVTSTKKVMAHDESNAIPVGALVRLVESKPLSKRKRWVVEAVLEQPDSATVEVRELEKALVGDVEATGEATESESEEAEA